MGKPSKRNIGEIDSYESDGGCVSDDDNQAPKSKKTKQEEPSSKGTTAGNRFWTLSSGRNPRRIEISEFKAMKLINIREFYEKDDTYLPGKKGISLTVDQYRAFLNAIPEINASLREAGIDIATSAVEDDDGADTRMKPQKKAKVKKDRSNIEATSDEEE